jgi:hypothetical protein
MDQIERRIDEKRRELKASLEPIFGDDSPNTAAMLIAALCREFGDPHPLARLDQLPKGSTLKPRVLVNRLSEPPAFGVIFVEGGRKYIGSRRFETEREADEHGSEFLVRLREEVTRP